MEIHLTSSLSERILHQTLRPITLWTDFQSQNIYTYFIPWETVHFASLLFFNSMYVYETNIIKEKDKMLNTVIPRKSASIFSDVSAKSLGLLVLYFFLENK